MSMLSKVIVWQTDSAGASGGPGARSP